MTGKVKKEKIMEEPERKECMLRVTENVGNSIPSFQHSSLDLECNF